MGENRMNKISSLRPYRLFFEHRPGYLFASVQSDIMTYEVARGYWVEILSMVYRRRYGRVLIQKDVPYRLQPHEAVDLVNELAHTPGHAVSVGILDRHYDLELSGFEETLAKNRGLNWRVHNDIRALEHWLLIQPTLLSSERHRFPYRVQPDVRLLPMFGA